MTDVRPSPVQLRLLAALDLSESLVEVRRVRDDGRRFAVSTWESCWRRGWLEYDHGQTLKRVRLTDAGRITCSAHKR